MVIFESQQRVSASLRHVGSHFLLQTVGEAVVEEEELPVRKQAAEQCIYTVALQQDLEERRRYTVLTTAVANICTAAISFHHCCLVYFYCRFQNIKCYYTARVLREETVVLIFNIILYI